MKEFDLWLSALSIPLVLGSWGIIVTERAPYVYQPEWFRRIIPTGIGTVILFISGIIVVISIFWSFSPDDFWYRNY